MRTFHLAPQHDGLLDRITGGDPVALKLLYDQISPGLRAHLTQHLNDPKAVEDLVVELFVCIWHRPQDFRTTSATSCDQDVLEAIAS